MAAEDSPEWRALLRQRGAIVMIWKPTRSSELTSDRVAIFNLAAGSVYVDTSKHIGIHDPKTVKVGHAAILLYPGSDKDEPYRFLSFWPNNPEDGLMATSSALHSYAYDCQLEETPPHVFIPLVLSEFDHAQMLASTPRHGTTSDDIQYQLFAVGEACNCATYVLRVLQKSTDEEFQKTFGPPKKSSWKPSQSSEQLNYIRPTILQEKAQALASSQFSKLRGDGWWRDSLPKPVLDYINSYVIEQTRKKGPVPADHFYIPTKSSWLSGIFGNSN
jgi:hypothetical protein